MTKFFKIETYLPKEALENIKNGLYEKAMLTKLQKSFYGLIEWIKLEKKQKGHL